MNIIDRAIAEIASQLDFDKTEYEYFVGDGTISVELERNDSIDCKSISIKDVSVCNGIEHPNIANYIRKHLSVDIKRMNTDEYNYSIMYC